MNKTLLILGVVVLVVLGFLGYYGGQNLGSQTVNYSNSLSQANLYNELNSIVQDLSVIRTPLAAVLSSSTVWDIGAIGTSTIATTSITVTGAAVGDLVLANIDSITATSSILLSAQVVSANTVVVQAASTLGAAGVSPINPPSGTLYVKVFPQSSFTAPAALNTVTSTSN